MMGAPSKRTKTLFWDYGRDETYLRPGKEDDQSPNLAIREGTWKLLMNADGSRVELYDFDTETKERVNVAAEHADVTKRLREKLLAWRRSLPELPR